MSPAELSITTSQHNYASGDDLAGLAPNPDGGNRTLTEKVKSPSIKILVLATSVMLFVSLPAWAQVQVPCGVANQIYCQPWDGTGNAFSSQNDTNGFGNFATVYDNFTFRQTWDVESFHWVGEYFNPPQQGTITGWTLTFYSDNAGQPGSSIFSGFFPGNGNETFVTNANGFPTYMYSLYFNSFDMAPGTYWASVVPDLGFPPQWGWSSGTGGDGVSYQDFFGTRSQLGTDMAFAIDGTAVPEPGTLVMLGSGLLGLASVLRRKLTL